MGQTTITDTGTGQQRQLDLGPDNHIAISNVPASAPPPAPAISAQDVALGATQQKLQPLPSHAPDPVWAANVRDARQGISARPKMTLSNQPLQQGLSITSEQSDKDYAHLQWLKGGIGTLTEPLGLTDYAAQMAEYGEPDSPEKRHRQMDRLVGGINVAGDEVFGPLKGFYSRFQTEVIPRLPKIAQNPKTIQNLVDKFVRKDEWQWMGGPEWLASRKGPVTKQEVEAWFQEHQIKVQERVGGGAPQLTADEQASVAKAKQARQAFEDRYKQFVEKMATNPDPQVKDPSTRQQLLERLHSGGRINPDLPAEWHTLADEQAHVMLMEHEANVAESNASGRLGPTRWNGQYILPGQSEHYREHHLIIPSHERYRGEIPTIEYQPPVTETATSHYRQPETVVVHRGTYGPNHEVEIQDYTGQERYVGDDEPVHVNIGPEMDTNWFRSVEDAKAAIAKAIQAKGSPLAREMRYKHNHFGQIPDYFLHERGTIRQVPGVGKVWFVDEAQSDAHQAAFKYGYRMPGDKAKAAAAYDAADTRVVAAEGKATDAGLDYHALVTIQQSLTERANKSVEEVIGDVEAALRAKGEPSPALAARTREAADAVRNEHPEVAGEMQTAAINHQDDPIPIESLSPALRDWATLWNGLKHGTEVPGVAGITVENAALTAWRHLLAEQGPVIRDYIEAEAAYAKAAWGKEMVSLAPPNMPFKDTWEELALRVAIRDAAEAGADAIGWPTGQHILDVYNQSLAKVKSLSIQTTNRGQMYLTGLDRNGHQLAGHSLESGSQIKDYVGEANAKRLLAAPAEYTGSSIKRTVHFGENESFLYGNKGVGQQYDKTWVKQANQIGKEHGVQVEKVSQPDVAPDYGYRPQFEREPFVDPTGVGAWQRAPYVPNEYAGPPDPGPYTRDLNWKPDPTKYTHWVRGGDQLENNGAQLTEAWQLAREQEPELFDGDKLRDGVELAVKDVSRTGDYDWRIYAGLPGQDGVDLLGKGGFPDFDQYEGEGAGLAIVESLRAGSTEPNRWRFAYNRGPDPNIGAPTKDMRSRWYQSRDYAERVAQQQQNDLDLNASNVQRRLHDTPRRAAHEELQNAYLNARTTYRRSEAARLSAHERKQDKLEEAARVAERARLEAAGEPTLAQLQAAHEAAEDARKAAWDKEHGAPDPKSFVSILRLPKKWVAELTTKGQPLPSLLAPLTGAGLALMASHKREQAARKEAH